MSSKHYSQLSEFFFFISGILKCFLSSVAHFTSFEIRQKNKIKNPTLPIATLSNEGQATGHAVVIFKGETIVRNHAWYFHKHKCKATYIEIGVLSGCQG